jgi:hypothetical protein
MPPAPTGEDVVVSQFLPIIAIARVGSAVFRWNAELQGEPNPMLAEFSSLWDCGEAHPGRTIRLRREDENRRSVSPPNGTVATA